MITDSTVKNLKFKLNQISPLRSQQEFYRCPSSNVVYMRNLKAASTTYTFFFTKLGWKRCEMKQIDWEKDLVFGHILDPLTRYRKGMTEAFHRQYDLTQILKVTDCHTSFSWIDFIANAQIIDKLSIYDRHTITLGLSLKENAKKIYWIPIDIDLDHKIHTLEFLNLYHALPKPSDNLEKFLLDWPDYNQSTVEKKKFYDALCTIQPSSSLLHYLDFDQCLYAATVYHHKKQ